MKETLEEKIARASSLKDILFILRDKIKLDTHVATLAYVKEVIQSPNENQIGIYSCTPFPLNENQEQYSIQAYSFEQHCNINDTVLIVFTDLNFISNLKAVDYTPKITSDSDLHSLKYGVIVTLKDSGIGPSGSFVRYDINDQGLSSIEKDNARTNIGAGTSNFSGDYYDLSNRPIIPTKTSELTNDSGYLTSVSWQDVIDKPTIPTIDEIRTYNINGTNSSDLGSSTVSWKNLYLGGRVNPVTYNNNSVGLILPDTSGFTGDKTIATNDIISDAYDNTATYAVGDCCIYNNTLYKCNTAITTAEDFNSTKWDAITITELVNAETIVRTTGDQTVAGKKKFTSIPEAKEMIFRNNVSSPTGSALSIQNDNGYNAKIRFNNRGFMFTAGSVYPTDNNVMDFGATNYLWKNIYVSGNLSDGTNSVPVALLSGVSGAYATNSTTELKYSSINNISISANTTFTLATAPNNTYPEYKANITNTDTSNAITITLPSGTIIKVENGITVSSNTFTIPADTTVVMSLQDDLALVMIKG